MSEIDQEQEVVIDKFIEMQAKGKSEEYGSLYPQALACYERLLASGKTVEENFYLVLNATFLHTPDGKQFGLLSSGTWPDVEAKYPDKVQLAKMVESLIPKMPRNADFWFYLATRLAMLGRFERALYCASQGQGIDPTHKELKKLIPQLRESKAKFGPDESLDAKPKSGCLGLVLVALIPLVYFLLT